MTIEDTILKYKKPLRITIFVCLCLTFFALIAGAFYELYHPDSPMAKQLLGLANTMIYIVILLAIPLLYLKIKSIESWNVKHEGDTAEDKRKALWEVTKPFVKEIVIAIIIFTIMMAIFNYFDIIPQSTVDSYKQYYISKNLLGN